VLFNNLPGPCVALRSRSKSFPSESNSYRVKPAPDMCFEELADGMVCALAMADEVARNGALQRITSARGFLGRPLQFPEALPPLSGKHQQFFHSMRTVDGYFFSRQRQRPTQINPGLAQQARNCSLLEA